MQQRIKNREQINLNVFSAMSVEEREKLIEFIKRYDTTYSYTNVNFKYYTNADLLDLKRRLEKGKSTHVE